MLDSILEAYCLTAPGQLGVSAIGCVYPGSEYLSSEEPKAPGGWSFSELADVWKPRLAIEGEIVPGLPGQCPVVKMSLTHTRSVLVAIIPADNIARSATFYCQAKQNFNMDNDGPNFI